MLLSCPYELPHKAEGGLTRCSEQRARPDTTKQTLEELRLCVTYSTYCAFEISTALALTGVVILCVLLVRP